MSKHLRKIRDQLNKAKKEGGDILSFLKNIFGESGERAVVFSSRFRELIDLILDNIEDLEGNRETVRYLYKLASQMGYEGIMYLHIHYRLGAPKARQNYSGQEMDLSQVLFG